MKLKKFNKQAYLNNQHEELYIEDVKKHVILNRQIRITDLTDAMKTGKICTEYSITFVDKNLDQEQIACLNFMNDMNWNIESVFNFCEAQNWEKDKWGGYNEVYEYDERGNEMRIYRSDRKSVRTWSPFNLDVLKPLNETPSKWTLKHVIRALVNDQGKVVCRGVYTDDYAFDAAYNYQQGDVSSLHFAKRLLTSPSGWWVGSPESNGSMAVCCHHFDTNDFTPFL